MLSCIKNREPEAEHSESVPFKKKKKNPGKIKSGGIQIFKKDLSIG